MLKSWIKDPGATLDYSIDWATKGWLQPNETIQAVSWGISTMNDPADLAVPVMTPLAISSTGFTGLVATVWLTAGDAGAFYLVECTITTNQGRTDSRSFQIQSLSR